MKPLASLSLDLDNQWSYLKTHGDADWSNFPSYLDVLVPRVIEVMAARDLSLTFFVVGQDAALAANRDALARLGDSPHEIGNHSFHHEPWLHLYSGDAVRREIERADEVITAATGKRAVGFRGPGFSVSAAVLEVLRECGYRFDASTLPTFLGPLARAYYFFKSDLRGEERRKRRLLFGRFREGFRPLRPYLWELSGGTLLEIPVTTFPLVKTPFHISYILYLSTFSERLARVYFRSALKWCQRLGVEPSILLHPLDFLGREDVDGLDFFPGMQLERERKLARLGGYLDELSQRFEVLPMGRHAEELGKRDCRRRRFAAETGA